MSQLETALWSVQSVELPELRVALHSQERRISGLEDAVADGGQVVEGNGTLSSEVVSASPNEHVEELRSLVSEQRMSQLETALWSVQSVELPELRVALHSQERRISGLESRQPEAITTHQRREERETMRVSGRDGEQLDATGSIIAPSVDAPSIARERTEAPSNAGEEAAGGHQPGRPPRARDLQSAPSHLVSRSESGRAGAEDGGGPVRAFGGPESSAGVPNRRDGGDHAVQILSDTSAHSAQGSAAIGGDGDAGSGEAFEQWPHSASGSSLWPHAGDGAAGSSGLGVGDVAWSFAGDGAAGSTSMRNADIGSGVSWPADIGRSNEAWPRAGDGAAGSAERERTAAGDVRRSSSWGWGGDGAAGGSEEDGHFSHLGGDGAAGGGRAMEGDYGGGAPGASGEAAEAMQAREREPDEADRAAVQATLQSSQGPRQPADEGVELVSPDSASQDFEDDAGQPQSLDDALLSLVSRTAVAGSQHRFREMAVDASDAEEDEFDHSESGHNNGASRSSSDLSGSAKREEPEVWSVRRHGS